MKIVLIGSGNVATVLGRKMSAVGHAILQVFSPNILHARELGNILHCTYTSSWKEIDRTGDIYIAAIADHSLAGIANHLSLQNRLVVHTAGSVRKDVLKEISTNYGVLYPLQSLRKEIEDFPEINLLVDGNTPDDLTLIYDFASTFGDHVEIASDEKRLKLHVAAVLVSNFSNHLYALAENYCAGEEIEFKLLLPLIQETANRLQFGSAEKMQTGPAVRNDMQTIQKHLDILEKHPELKNIFEIFTRSIQDFYRQERKKD